MLRQIYVRSYSLNYILHQTLTETCFLVFSIANFKVWFGLFFLQLMKIQTMQICQTEIYVNDLCIYHWYLLAVDSRPEFLPKNYIQLKSV
jgi:hypothetical protein